MKLILAGVGHAFLGKPVFDNIDLSLSAGEVVALVGPSGCGKTTVLQIAAGLVEPLRGRVHRSYQRHAAVFQDPRLLPWMTTRDNISYGLRASGMRRKLRSQVAEQRAREVGLTAADLDKYPAELSGGMRQRAAVARAFAVHPDVVFFDEPFTAVDVGLRRALQDLVIEAAARDRFSALFVTHDLAEAIRIAHRVVVFAGDAGGIIESRSLQDAPGERSKGEIFAIVEGWARDAKFRELFDGAKER